MFKSNNPKTQSSYLIKCHIYIYDDIGNMKHFRPFCGNVGHPWYSCITNESIKLLLSVVMLSPIAVNGPKPQSATGIDSISRKFLGDLGKPTLRGVRKCSKCGTLNGTRGIRCKNQSCDQVFKAGEKKKPTGPEAVKLVTGWCRMLAIES